MSTFEIILSILTALSSGGWVGAFLERKKRMAETRQVEADVFQKMEEQYSKFIKHSENKIEELHQENEKLKKRIKELETQIYLLRKDNKNN